MPSLILHEFRRHGLLPGATMAETTVIRTWRRDNSNNPLTLSVAVDWLIRDGLPEVKRLGESGVRAALLRGEPLMTSRATFRVDAPAVNGHENGEGP